MLSDDDQRRIKEVTAEAWRGHSAGDIFRSMFQGKERGHRIADFVEEKTVETLEEHFDVKHEVTGVKRRARGMGDAWVLSNEIYNPINVKAGVYGIGGQPNMVSLTKITSALLEHLIDSYYLLLVTFRDEEPPVSDVQLVDILQHLDFLHFDSGTGQLMLQADRFANHVSAGGAGIPLTLEETVEHLVEKRRVGDSQLVETRRKNLEKLEKRLAAFDPARGVDQSDLRFG